MPKKELEILRGLKNQLEMEESLEIVIPPKMQAFMDYLDDYVAGRV